MNTIIAIVVAGIAGTIANSVAITAFLGAELLPLILSLGRNLVAIACCAMLPPILRAVPGTGGAILAIAALTVVPSVLAKLVFGVGAPWLTVLGLNLVYAVVAYLVYLAIQRRTV